MIGLAIYNNNTGNVSASPCLQDLTVSGYYGPGNWAAWCITLFASWIPLLSDNYTHDLHFIVYALYTNGAAVHTFLFWTLEDDFEELLDNWYKLREDVSAMILQKWDEVLHRQRNQESYHALREDLNALEDFNKSLNHWKHEDWGTILLPPVKWPNHQRAPDQDEARFQERAATHIEACQHLYSQLAQFLAAKSVLLLGSLNALAQLLVCLAKASNATSTEIERLRSRRNEVINIGLLMPSFLMLLEAYSFYPGLSAGYAFYKQSVSAALWLTCLHLCFGFILWQDPFWARDPMAPLSYNNIPVIIGSSAYCIQTIRDVLFSDIRTSRICHFMPCTSVKIAEYDQAFALFLALVCFLYEFGDTIPELFKLSWSHVARLLSRARSQPKTSPDVPLEQQSP